MMLFDLATDPAEQHDVSAQHPDVVARLKTLFDKMEAQFPPEFRAKPDKPRR